MYYTYVEINMWKEETPVSRLIDYVGRQNVTIKLKFIRLLQEGVLCPLLFFQIWRCININKQKKNGDALVNDDIRSKEMLVITDSGEKLGVLPRNKALQEAENRGLDLVLVSPDSNPPVAKLMDYSRFRFEQQKKAKEMKKKQKIVVVQEIQLSTTIEKHDFETKMKKARTILLDKGNKVKVTLRFYGRMIVHQDLGIDVVNRFVEGLADCSTVESPVKLDGKTLFAVIAPKIEKKQ